MGVKESRNSNKINRERILLASIPVIGSIIVAYFAYVPKPDPVKTVDPVEDTVRLDKTRISRLKETARKVNDMIVYKRYSDLSEMMSDGLKPIVTREKFNEVSEKTSKNLGAFVKALEITYTYNNGNDNFFVKNQYQKGLNINQIIFDSNGKVYGIFTDKYPD
ncbi:hypothetical protein [Flavobacterium notoginsengisoli]|uniref:hypothetical protein n=1 Tax=Flavobacterium notoginsengisoli TaxID=1478199 RepID=UPI003641A026